jgi:hypothetical protein
MAGSMNEPSQNLAVRSCLTRPGPIHLGHITQMGTLAVLRAAGRPLIGVFDNE